MKTINNIFRTGLMLLVLALSVQSVNGQSDWVGPGITEAVQTIVTFDDPELAEDLGIMAACPAVTSAVVVSGNGCMPTGATSVVVGITATGQNGATFKLWNQQTPDDDDILYDTKIARSNVNYRTLNFTATATGNYTLWVSQEQASGCTESPRTAVSFSVTQVPAIDDSFSVTGTATHCEGDTFSVSLSGSQNSGVIQYFLQRQPPGGGSFTDVSGAGFHTGNGSGHTWSGLTLAGTYRVEARTTCNGLSDIMTGTAVVDFDPRAETYSISQTVFDCPGGTNLGIALPDSQAGYTYKIYKQGETGEKGSWTSPTDNASHTFYVTSTGIHYIQVLNQGACAGTTEDMNNTVSVSYYPEPTIPNSISAITKCVGESVTITPAGGGGDVSTYRWYTSASTSNTSTHWADATTKTFNAPSGTTDYYIAAVSSNGCVGPRRHVEVTGNAIPGAPGGLSSFSFCLGGAAPTMTPSGGSTYKWYTVASGGSAEHTGTSYSPTTSFTSKTWHVATVSAQGCESTARTAITLTKQTPPQAFTFQQEGEACDVSGPFILRVPSPESGTTYTLFQSDDSNQTAIAPFVNNGTEIKWSVPNHTSYTVRASRHASCNSQNIEHSLTPTFTGKPSTPTAVGGTTQQGCIDEPVVVSVSNAAQENVTAWKWYTNSGLTNEVPNHNDASSITVTVTAITQHYYVVAINGNNCQSVNAQHIQVQGLALPSAPSHAGSMDICDNATTAVISLTSVSGDGNYTAYDVMSGGSPITSGTANLTIPVPLATQTKTVYIERTNGNSCDSDSRTAVTINRLPVPQTFDLQQYDLAAFCVSTDLRLAGSVVGVTYQLFRDGNLEQTLPGTGSELLWPGITQSGNYTVEASYGSCNSVAMNNSLDLIIQNATVYDVSGGGTACVANGQQVTLSGSQSDFAYYLKRDGSIDFTTYKEGTGSAITWTEVRGSGDYTVVSFSDGCGYVDMNLTVNVDITPVPQAPTAENVVVYTGDSTPKFIAANSSETSTFNWYDESESFLQTNQNYPLAGVTTNSVFYVEAEVNGCVSPRTRVSITFTNASEPDLPEHVIACEQHYLRMTGTIPTDVVWYWQGENPNGTDKALDASKYDYRLLKDGTYYLRAYDEVNRIWGPTSTSSGAISVTNPTRVIPVDCDDIQASYVEPTPLAYESTGFYNYVGVYTVQKYGMTETEILSETDNRNVMLTTDYIDGLGRPIQKVNRSGSSNGKDIISLTHYDGFGREALQYLPFESIETDGVIKTNPYLEQKKFYEGDGTANYPGYQSNESTFYSKTIIENSILGRPLLTMGAGDAWSGSGVGVRMVMNVNTLENGVRIWAINNSGIPVSGVNDIYNAGDLTSVMHIDEDGKRVIQYSNKSGQIVLTKAQSSDSPSTNHSGWLNTYYIYDDNGNVRFVVSPRATELLEDAGWVWNSGIMNELVTQFNYDNRGRVITQRTPGAERKDIVYDQLDRPVLSQDGNQRDKNQWTFTKYDMTGRVALSGLYTSLDNRLTLQGIVDNWDKDLAVMLSQPDDLGTVEGHTITLSSHVSGTTKYHAQEAIIFLQGFDTDEAFETEIGGALTTDYTSVMGYQDATFPLLKGSEYEVLVVNYYDNYDFTDSEYDVTDPGFNTEVLNDPLNAVSPEVRMNVVGVQTGSRVKVLDSNDQWISLVNFYDDRGRKIQTQKGNHIGGEDISTIQYDFSGKILNRYNLHSNNISVDNATTDMFEQVGYDVNGQLIHLNQKLNGAAGFQRIVTNSYDPLGRLEIKELGDVNNPIETLDYSFNIRGWLKGVNESFVEGTETDRFFGMALRFDAGYNMTHRNGNIAGTKWKTKSSSVVRSYGFDYDGNNQLTKADYGQEGGQESGWSNTHTDFSTNYSYDANGNILRLKRSGVVAGIVTVIDDLTYDYGSGFGLAGSSNQLLKVQDTAGGYGLGDFKNGSNTDNDYSYDLNGNMVRDRNKDIQDGDITYNHLNLPVHIEFENNPDKTISFTYDALGAKLSKTVNENGVITVTDYAAGFIYENNTLQHLRHEEGRVRIEEGVAKYDYFIQDHLGNTRMTLTDARDSTVYEATMETELATFEESVFLNISETRDATGNGAVQGTQAARLNPAEYAIGPAKMLVVSPMDTVDLSVFARYSDTFTSTTAGNSTNLGAALAGLFGSSGVGATLQEQGVYNALNNNSGSFLASTFSSGTSSVPLAYLNYVFFDQDFNMVPGSTGYVPISTAAENAHELLEANGLVMPSAGYLYVYVSNEGASTTGGDVYFDALRINHKKGPIVQEDHYYPFGLTIQALSSKSALSKPNDFLYNDGSELNTSLDLGVYETQFRMYDPVIGRWWQVDPLADESKVLFNWSPYNYSLNSPIRYNDPNGDVCGGCVTNAIMSILYEFAFIYLDNKFIKNMDWGEALEAMANWKTVKTIGISGAIGFATGWFDPGIKTMRKIHKLFKSKQGKKAAAYLFRNGVEWILGTVENVAKQFVDPEEAVSWGDAMLDSFIEMGVGKFLGANLLGSRIKRIRKEIREMTDKVTWRGSKKNRKRLKKIKKLQRLLKVYEELMGYQEEGTEILKKKGPDVKDAIVGEDEEKESNSSESSTENSTGNTGNTGNDENNN